MSSGYVLRVGHRDGADYELAAPTVGIFTPSVTEGELVSPGQAVGAVEVLGVRHSVRVPADLAGRVTSMAGHGRARVPVQYGDTIITVSSDADLATARPSPKTHGVADTSLAFAAPMSGRFYSRPSPSEAVFVKAGDTVRRGQTIGLLEVMKTFNRLVYQGDGLPEVAVVDAIVPADGDDVVRGDVILALRLQ